MLLSVARYSQRNIEMFSQIADDWETKIWVRKIYKPKGKLCLRDLFQCLLFFLNQSRADEPDNYQPEIPAIYLFGERSAMHTKFFIELAFNLRFWHFLIILTYLWMYKFRKMNCQQ